MQSSWRPSPFLTASVGLHLSAIAAVVLAPAWWLPVLSLLAVDHLIITVAGLDPRSRLLGLNVSRLPPAASPRVALTFDDGPDPNVTPAVLDLLDSVGARASFFCVARRVERHPHLAREIHARGHRVENHSLCHRHNFAFLGPTRLTREISQAQDSIEKVVGRRPILFRAPAGVRSVWLDAVLSRLRLRLVSWTRRGFDTVSRDPRQVVRRLTRGLGDGDILLLHDGSAAYDEKRTPVVLSALPPLLQALAERGLPSVPVDEALEGTNP